MSKPPQTTLILPTQAEFLEHGLVRCSADSSVPAETECTICVELCLPEQDILKIAVCQACYFHSACLTAWLNSNADNRGTCPNDRTRLFTIAQTTSEDQLISQSQRSQRTITLANRFAEVLLTHHEAAVTPTEIIDTWHADQTSRILAVEHMVGMLRLYNARDHNDTFQALEDAAVAVEAIVSDLRARYQGAVRQVLFEHLADAEMRVNAMHQATGRHHGYYVESIKRLVQEMDGANPDYSATLKAVELSIKCLPFLEKHGAKTLLARSATARLQRSKTAIRNAFRNLFRKSNGP
jgi:hypothetical protein